MTAILGGTAAGGHPLTKDHLARIWPKLAGAFSDMGNGRLVNLKLERQRSGLDEYLTAKSRAGIASAEARRKKLGTAQPGRAGEQTPNTEPNSQEPVRGSVHRTQVEKQAENTAIVEQPSNPASAPASASAVPSVKNTEGPSLFDDSEPTSVDALVEVWNTERQPGPKVTRTLPAARRQAAQRALKEVPNLADWRIVIRYLNSQPFANAPGTGSHGTWRASLDWLIKPGKCAEYLERQRLDGTRAGERDGELVGRDASRGRTGWQRGKYTGLGRTATGE